MTFFGKKKPDNWIIKLFKITDLKSAEQFDMQRCFLSAIEAMHENTPLRASHFDLNYKDSYSSLGGFKKALTEQKEIVVCFVEFTTDKSSALFTVSNPMLNYTQPPQNAAVDICFQISSDFLTQDTTEQIAEQFLTAFHFDYGYITKMPANFDALTERKIKRGLFSTGVEINERDHVWTQHSVGILEGYIKQIYAVNYLNQSQRNKPEIKDVIPEYGTLESISDTWVKWTLNPDEISHLKNNEAVRSVSFITEDLDFLKTQKAKEFKKRMEFH